MSATQVIHTSGEISKNYNPFAEYHIYIDENGGSDLNKGFGTDDPTDPDNWSNAVQSGAHLQTIIPEVGKTIIHSMGNVTFEGDCFPYAGFDGECTMISYDDPTVIATGVIASVNASTDDFGWGEMTVTWDGGYVPTDAELRTAFLKIEYDNGNEVIHKILQWTDPGAGGLGIRLPSNVSGDTSVGKTVTVITPTPQITFSDGHYEGYYVQVRGNFIGYKITTDQAGTGTFGVAPHGRASWSFCHLNPVWYSLYTISQDFILGFDSFIASSVGLDVYLKAGLLNRYTGIYVAPTGGGGLISINTGNLNEVLMYGSVVEESGVGSLPYGALSILKSRIVDSDVTGVDLTAFARALIEDSKISSLQDHGDGMTDVRLVGAIGLSTGATGRDYSGKPSMFYMNSGSRIGTDGATLLMEGDAADAYLATLFGVDVQDLIFGAVPDLATPGTPRPAVIIDGGSHRSIQFVHGNTDRGVGPIDSILGAADLDLKKATGTNTNVGNGYGVFVDEKAFVRADKSACTISGTAGALKVGSKAVGAFPNAGVLDKDLTNPPAATDTLAMVKGY